MAKKSTDPCRAQRARVARSEEKLLEMEDRLPDTPPSQRPRLEEQIRAERARLAGFLRRLADCLDAH